MTIELAFGTFKTYGKVVYFSYTHKARLLMVQDGLNATLAANKVGYESASQFSREFKRMFGKSPMEEVNAVRSALITHPSDAAAKYVTVQQ